jgi:hypothetical protein
MHSSLQPFHAYSSLQLAARIYSWHFKKRKEFIRGNWQMLGVSPLAGAGTVASDWLMIPSS